MKSLIGEYYKVVLYTIFGLMIVMSSYCIILNIHHYNAISSEVTVSDIDTDYKEYINNINKIEDNVSKLSNSELARNIKSTVEVMKKSGVFRLIPKTKLGYHDLYDLNDYFIERLINDCWVRYFNMTKLGSSHNDIANMLISNANYINSHLTDNSLTLYDSKDDSKIIDDYHFIVRNYVMYSNIILDLCNSLGGEQ